MLPVATNLFKTKRDKIDKYIWLIYTLIQNINRDWCIRDDVHNVPLKNSSGLTDCCQQHAKILQKQLFQAT